jgi:cell wall-associated NlpC family hydrolase
MATRTHRLSRALVLLSTIVLAAPMIDAQVASATSVDDQKAEVARIVDQLDKLNEQADILAEDYSVAVDEKNQLDIDIAKSAERVAAKQDQLTKLQGDLAQVAVRTFTGAGSDVLGPLFSNASSYSAALRRDQYSRVALNVGTGTTDDLDALITDLAHEQKDLADKRDHAQQLTQEISDKQSQVEKLTAQYVEQRTAAEARLGDLITQEEARRDAAALAKLQQQAQQAQQKAAASSGSDNNGGGGSNNNGGGGSDNNGGGGNDSSNAGNNDAGGGQASGGGQDSGSSNAGGGDTGGGGGGGSDSGGGGSSVPVSGLAGTAINAAMSQIGVPYHYAMSVPGVGFDCSGLTHYAWGQAGVYLPSNSRAQAAATPHVPPADAQPGDLIFFYTPISHVAIYLGGGQLVHAPNTGNFVTTAPVNWSHVVAVGRPG